MRKFFSIFLILILIFSLCFSISACKKNDVNSISSQTQTESLHQGNKEEINETTNGSDENDSSVTENTSDNNQSEESDTHNPSSTIKPSDKETQSGTTKPNTETTKPTETSKPTETEKPNTESKPTVPDNNGSTTTDKDKPSDNNPTTESKPNTSTDSSNQKPQVVSPSAQMITVIKNEFYKLVNEERSKFGFNALTLNTTLSSAADVRAKECFDVFSHTRPNGSSYTSLFDDGEFEYDYCALAENITLTTNFGDKYITEENIFVGTNTQLKEIANILFTNFKNSKPHYTTMLSTSYEDIGIGISTSVDIKTNVLYISCCNLFGTK